MSVGELRRKRRVTAKGTHGRAAELGRHRAGGGGRPAAVPGCAALPVRACRMARRVGERRTRVVRRKAARAMNVCV